MGSVSTAMHLLSALRRAAGRVFIAFILTLVIVGALSEGLHYVLTPSHQNGVLTHIVSAALAVGWALAISLLVLVGEVIRGLVTGVRDAAKDVEHEVADAGSLVTGVVHSLEGKNEPKR
jgi:hypothetical protein